MGSTLITGRKLLLADDSLAVQKVIDLTFTDEGMQVTTVGDGEAALQRLEQSAPDVILADVFMPGLNGYSLCERVKQDERFGRIPVILLVGSFEPFDEVEARRVGADDVVTKPFQSIRQLVSRVGSLVGGRSEDFDKTQPLSTLGLQGTETASAEDGLEQPKVTVLVEAPVMSDTERFDVTGKTCSPDIELQTADTQQLPPVIQDTDRAITRPAMDSFNAAQMNAMDQPTTQPTTNMTDALLDLDDVVMSSAAGTDDFILDLDTEIAPPDEQRAWPATAITVEEAFEVAEIVEPASEVASPRFERKTMSSAYVGQPPPQAQTLAEPAAPQANLTQLSPEVIDAIVRRVVEQLSDKVVRDIAWEVVPELAELLIKQRLDEQNR